MEQNPTLVPLTLIDPKLKPNSVSKIGKDKTVYHFKIKDSINGVPGRFNHPLMRTRASKIHRLFQLMILEFTLEEFKYFRRKSYGFHY